MSCALAGEGMYFCIEKLPPFISYINTSDQPRLIIHKYNKKYNICIKIMSSYEFIEKYIKVLD